MSRAEELFSDGDLGESIAFEQQKVLKEIERAAEDYTLNVDTDEWVAYLVEEHTFEQPVILRDQVELEDAGAVDVDVSYSRDWDYGHGTRASLPGRRMVLHIPFDGDAGFFRLHPSQWDSGGPPRAEIRVGELVRVFEYPSNNRPDLDAEANDLLNRLERWVDYGRPQIETHNAQLEGLIRSAIESKRQRLLADRDHLAGLKIPIRSRDDAPQTFTAAEIRRKRGPAPPRAPAAPPTVPEPTLAEAIYEHVLDVLRSAGHSMERAPDTYAAMGEEARRNVLLSHLNTHYEGEAVGEAFNKHGKTDILLRREDQNLFIAECKFWSGPASITKTLDQLLNYATWRDTKLALVIWVKTAELTQIIDKARTALEAHPAFKRWIGPQPEGELRAKVRLAGDEDREAHLHVFLFHTPTTQPPEAVESA